MRLQTTNHTVISKPHKTHSLNNNCFTDLEHCHPEDGDVSNRVFCIRLYTASHFSKGRKLNFSVWLN